MLRLETGTAAYVPGANVFDDYDFGYNYTGFRALSRFDTQMQDSKLGLITWPGGSMAENGLSKFGLEYDGLWNGAAASGNLPELMALANQTGAGLAVVLPTLRYANDLEGMKADIQDFMHDLLGGTYGPLPSRMIFEIGSEFYSTFCKDPNPAATYGKIADHMIREIQNCLDNPDINVLQADIEIAAQAGRSLGEDSVLRAQLSDDTFRSVDMVIHHRFAVQAVGVDRSADDIHQVLEAWDHDAAQAGGQGPSLYLGTYNVASLTRNEAHFHYLKGLEAQGIDTTGMQVDLAGRTDTDFEEYWQHRLEKYDYGAKHPRVMLEMMAEYGAEGLGGAGTYGTDMLHAGRLTYADASGAPVKFVGQDMLDMMQESIDGTHLLKISLTNGRGDPVWAYAYENDHKLVVFLSADGNPPGDLTLDIDGLGSTYHAVWGESLTAHVPDDWMTRFGIPDNPNVDETPEAQSFALGLREGVTPTVDGDSVTVALDDPHEVIRLSFAKTAAGAEEIAAFSQGEGVDLTHLVDADPDPVIDPVPDPVFDPGPQPDTNGDLPGVPMPDSDPADDPQDDDHDDGLHDAVAAAFESSGMAMGLALLALPMLALMGL